MQTSRHQRPHVRRQSTAKPLLGGSFWYNETGLYWKRETTFRCIPTKPSLLSAEYFNS